MLPVIMRLKVKNEEGRGVNLYIPLVLVYLLLLPFVLIVLPLGWWWYNRAVEKEGSAGKTSLKLIPAVLTLLGSLSGTEIEIKDKKSEVILKLI
ncbi:MAG: hypothetical protein JXR86_02210 [Spirochaetales bacterium]|nr:hypothetical protein [Spirochaetales bacterium]